MLNKLHRPKWQHKDPEIRQQAIASLDPNKAEDISIIHHLAQKDDAEQVRATAIKQLRDMQVLVDIVQAKTTQTDMMMAAQQIRQLLSKPSNVQKSHAEWLSKIFELNEHDLSPKEVAKIAIESDTGLTAFERIKDEQDFIDLVQSARQVKVKLAAIEKIESTSELKLLQKSVSEKTVLQIIRDKLKKHKAAEDEQARYQQEAEKICSTIEKLAPLPFDERYARRLQKLFEEWQNVSSSPRDKLQGRFDAAYERCKDTVDRYEAEQKNRQAIATAQKMQSDINKRIQNVLNLLCENISEYSASKIESELNDLADEWHRANETVVATDKQAKQYYQAAETIANIQQSMGHYQEQESSLEQSLENLEPPQKAKDINYKQASENLSRLKLLKQSIQWPEAIDKPKLLAVLESYLAAWQSSMNKINKANKAKIEQIHKKTTVLQKEIRKKNLISANKLYNYISKQVESLDKHFQEKEMVHLSRVSTSLSELRDWHQFATHPKKEALCGKMQALIEAVLDPMERAEQIQVLQNEWKQLNSSNSEIDQALWDRFKSASDKAFEPCLAYYAERDAKRAENLKKRMLVCDRLESFVQSADWANIDWKKVEAVEKNARNEWGLSKPVPNKEAKGIQKRFDTIIKQVREKLDIERENNLEERKRLVERANVLSTAEDLNQAIEQAIVLQKQWKEIGITFFRQDQKQWKKFRSACNKIFERRDQERSANKEKLQAEIDRAHEIIASIKEHQALDDDALIKAKAKLAELRREFNHAIKDIPIKQSKLLKTSFTEANKKVDRQLAGVDRRKKLNRFTAVEQLIDLCEQLEAGKTDETVQNKLKEQFDALPKKHQNVLQKRFTAANQYAAMSPEEKEPRFQANHRQRAKICIELEILLDIPSPEQHRSDRTAFQLEQLQQGLQARLSVDERSKKIQLLLLEWLANGPVSEEEKSLAKHRFDMIKKAAFR